MQKQLRANNFIRVPEVQVIGPTGEQLGTMKTHEALKLAQQQDLDLVEVGPNAQPPITKIMDLGKYLYQKERQEKKSGVKKQKEQETKTVRVGFKTGAHDLVVKAKKADEFLGEGHNVKVELTLRGREKGMADMGRQKLLEFLKLLQHQFITQDHPKRSPYGWVVMIQRDKKVITQNGKQQQNK